MGLSPDLGNPFVMLMVLPMTSVRPHGHRKSTRLFLVSPGEGTDSAPRLDGRKLRAMVVCDGSSSGENDCADASPMSEARRKRVLVAKSNADAADMLATYLSELGYDATPAYDGTQALTFARLLAPDVVVLDVELEGFDGFEVAERLRHANAGVCIIALSARPLSVDSADAAAACFDAHFVKLLNLDTLFSTINDLLSSRPRVP
jgi:CheY-like chemotaxis protein